MSVGGEEFKEALGCWSTGVSIVTACSGDAIHGMTVSAFNAVSLDPPLVLVCAEKTTNTLPLIAAGGVFAVNVLAADQQALSNKFASKEDEWARFDGLDWIRAETGAPILSGTLAAIDCRVVGALDAGDHVIYLGEVVWSRVDAQREPLLYVSGGYGTFRKL